MFKELFKRQLAEDFISLRFIINFVLVLISVIAFTFIFINHYQNMVEKYSNTQVENDKRFMQFSESPRNANGMH